MRGNGDIDDEPPGFWDESGGDGIYGVGPGDVAGRDRALSGPDAFGPEDESEPDFMATGESGDGAEEYSEQYGEGNLPFGDWDVPDDNEGGPDWEVPDDDDFLEGGTAGGFFEAPGGALMGRRDLVEPSQLMRPGGFGFSAPSPDQSRQESGRTDSERDEGMGYDYGGEEDEEVYEEAYEETGTEGDMEDELPLPPEPEAGLFASLPRPMGITSSNWSSGLRMRGRPTFPHELMALIQTEMQPRMLKDRARRVRRHVRPFMTGWFNPVYNALDADADGKIELGDVIGRANVEGPSLESTSKSLPIFIVLDTLMVLGPWTVEILLRIGGGGSPEPITQVTVGLENLFPGETELRTSLDCKDYRAQIWRWFTYQFSHVGINHVLCNSVMNILMGVPLERFHGTWRMILMYNAGVIGGAFCFMLIDNHSGVVGMSGGCYALLGMHLANLVMNWAQMKYRWTQIVLLFLLALMDFINVAASKLPGSKDTSFSHSVHFGGWVAGGVVSIVIGRNLVVKEFERVLMVVVLAVGAVLTTICLIWGMMWPPRSLLESTGWCWARQVSNYKIFGDTDWHCVRCQDLDCVQRWSQQEYITRVSVSHCEHVVGWSVTER